MSTKSPNKPRSRTRRAARDGSSGGWSLFRHRRARVVIRRASLVTLMLAGVVLATLVDHPAIAPYVDGPRAGMMTIVSPLHNGATRAMEPFRDAAGWTKDLTSATSAKPRLEAEIEELQAAADRAEVLAAENERLRGLLDLDQRYPLPAGVTEVPAEVIARSPGQLGTAVVVNRGTDHGVAVNDAVVTAEGLVGRVAIAGASSSRVIPVVADGEAASAMTVGSGAQGVVRPVSVEGTPVLDMAYVPTAVGVDIGDDVVTAGWRSGNLQSIYPAGVLIGTVSSSGSSPADIFKTIQVTPAVDFERIAEVVILSGSASTLAHEPLVSDEAAPTAKKSPASESSSGRRTTGDDTASKTRDASGQ